MIKLLLFSLVGALTVLSQDPSPCTSPVQLFYHLSVFDHGKNEFDKYKVTYDALNQREAWVEKQNVTRPGKRFFKFIRLCEERIMYTINLKTKVCTKSDSGPFRPIGIHANATFEDEFYEGGPGEELFATEWSDRVPHIKHEHWYGVFSKKNCYPIRSVYISKENITSTVTLEFYNIVDGIINPDEFIPPKECDAADWVDPPREYISPFL